MFWRKRATVGAEEMDWIIQHWRWLDAQFGPGDGDARRMPVLPSRTVFPKTRARGHAKAQHYFDTVRTLYRIPAGNCEMVAREAEPDLGSSAVFGQLRSSGAAGAYQPRGNVAQITYDPRIVDDPIQLIATFSYELAHLKLEYRTCAPPGGEETMEPLTDLTTVHMGFGLFGANSAFECSQSTGFDGQSWQTRRIGYLTEPQWCFALALAIELLDVLERGYAAYAKPSVATGIRKNRAFLQENPGVIPRVFRGVRREASQGGTRIHQRWIGPRGRLRFPSL